MVSKMKGTIPLVNIKETDDNKPNSVFVKTNITFIKTKIVVSNIKSLFLDLMANVIARYLNNKNTVAKGNE